MNRRDFLAASISFVGTLTARWAFAQPIGSKRAAVVIGVDKAGDLPKLNAARSGARSVADWLKSEGFEVRLFVDDPTPVTANDVFVAIKGFVDRGTLDQLVIYFAGHGFVSSSLSEFWLLSGGPGNPNEAISLIESRALARQSGIPNVVFISDACRSPAESARMWRVSGSVVFPTGLNSNVNTDVDTFLATRVGDAAYEVSGSATEAEGIYTASFLDAFKNPYPAIIQEVAGKPVVPNRRLKNYLAQEVPKRARARSITLNQQPDAEVNSDEPTFIGHVTSSQRLQEGVVTPTVSDVARSAWGGGETAASPRFSAEALKATATASGFQSAWNVIVQARGLSSQSSARTGFTVFGQRVRSVVAKPGIQTDFSNSPDAERPTALVEIDVQNVRAASVALQFSDGSGTVLAALDEYIGNVVVDGGKVSSVTYVPSRTSWKRAPYESEKERLEQMHAAVAAAARFGVFRIEGPKQTRDAVAAQLADRIRMLKGYDPTLGLYAAYAYADAGLSRKVESVRGYMRDDLGSDLFDVGMLAGVLSGKSLEGPQGPVPCCPMLSQGWGLLRVGDVRLPESIAPARDHLRPSLWLTLDSDGVQIAQNALRSGSLR